MCGIAGIYSKKQTFVKDLHLKKMSDVLQHRGPDNTGIWINETENIGFAHTRLSIIDLSPSGHQPMLYDKGRYVITFNGEIYNYIELRTELIKKGFEFKTSSDVEVLLALYALKKEECIKEIDGMFSFAIWDDLEKTLFCCRDRFGEKPFFFFKDKDSFIFASEIKAILKVVPSISINKVNLQQFLDSGIEIQNNSTNFNEVKSLEPGHYLKITPEKFQIEKYWEIDLSKRTQFKNEQEYVEKFKELFETSVKRRLRSDVKFGSCLSGGLDSSSIVGVINKIHGNTFNTFSSVFPGLDIDESKWIDNVSDFTGVTNIKITPEPNLFIKNLEKIIWHQETPIGSTSNFAQWCVMEMAKENGIKVLLDGQGADEFLAGYGDLKYFAIRDHYNNFEFKSFIREKSFFQKHFAPKERLGYLFYFDPFFKLLSIKRKEYEFGTTLKERLKHSVHFQLENLLRSADRNSMAHSIEVRLPFLFHELVEYVFSIPNDKIYFEGKTKHILRESVKNLIPDNVINRIDKIGFAAPQKEWFTNEDLQYKLKECEKRLKDGGYGTSNNSWRNLSAGTFLSVF